LITIYRYKNSFAFAVSKEMGKSYFFTGVQKSYIRYFQLTTGASVSFTSKFMMNSNIKYSTNRTLKGDPIRYALWNSSVNYRFLPANNLEVKLAALDILRQNKFVGQINTDNAVG